MQSVPITTKVVSSNPTHDEVYSIQLYVIKFRCDFTAGRWCSPGTTISSSNKTDHNIAEIVLKVVLNTTVLSVLLLFMASGDFPT